VLNLDHGAFRRAVANGFSASMQSPSTRSSQASSTRRSLGYPHSEGYCAAQTLIKAKKGETVPNFIDPADLAKNPLVVDKAWLDANPDFKAEWEG
jgi:hypothetical protein